MPTLHPAQRTFLTLLAFVWLSLLPADAASQLPLDKPLSFGTNKAVELSMELTRYRAYRLDVAFPFHDAKQRAYTRNIVGDPPPNCKLSNECGIPTKFRVTVNKGGVTIFNEEREALGHYAFDDRRYYRNITILRLKPGTYTIIVEPMGNTEDIANVEALIELSTDARASDLKD